MPYLGGAFSASFKYAATCASGTALGADGGTRTDGQSLRSISNPLRLRAHLPNCLAVVKACLTVFGEYRLSRMAR